MFDMILNTPLLSICKLVFYELHVSKFAPFYNQISKIVVK